MRNAVTARIALTALVVGLGIVRADGASLPTVSSGARPGPDVLRAAVSQRPKLDLGVELAGHVHHHGRVT